MATGTPLDFITAGSQLLGAVGSLNGRPAAPGYALSGGPLSNKTDVDFSGFTVATGGSKAEGATISKSTADALGGGTPSPLTAALSSVNPKTALYIGGGLLAVVLLWRILKK